MNNQYLLDNLRCIPDFPKKGVMFRDVTTLFKNPKCLRIMEEEMYELYRTKASQKLWASSRVASSWEPYLLANSTLVSPSAANLENCPLRQSAKATGKNMAMTPSKSTKMLSMKMTSC